jgi:threonine dehydrogenase-like Zn-dependent dehydrogenase
VPTPEPDAGEVLLEVSAASICGSDILRFAKGHKKYDLVLGHEWFEAVEAMQQGLLRVDTLVSHRFPPSEGPGIFDDVAVR